MYAEQNRPVWKEDAMDYSKYLPHIDVEGGKAVVMGNLKLYLQLVKKFEVDRMAEAVREAVKDGDSEKISQAAHAIRGTAAKLGFKEAKEVAEEIETNSDNKTKVDALMARFNDAIPALKEAIEELLATA